MNGGRNDRRRIAVAMLVALLSVVLIALVAGALGVLVSNTFGVDRETTSTVSLIVSGVASGAIATILVRRYRVWPKASGTRPKASASTAPDVSEKVSRSPESA
ncbi:hypothetical protein [Streptosporangium sp. V21-05]|uniref:hypothetical protein n=1 Tax=Streptosporangium sp. V21-05 TaxID=3446115 RepID=UPI003F5356D3